MPDWGRWPLVFLATAATVIASQSVITGAFSVAHQAVQLGYLSRPRIAHTSEETIGQVFVPWINWVLMVSVLTLVFTFETSSALAFAFGMAVTGSTITITTLLFFYVVRHQWRKPLWLVAIGAGFLLTVDLLFLGANLTKLVHGAWLPLLIGVIAFTVLTTWQLNRTKVTAPLGHARPRRASPHVERARRDPVDRDAAGPARSTGQRLVIDDLGYTDDAITHAGARFGYMDEPNVPAVLRLLEKADIECPLEVDEASYFLSTIDLRRGDAPGMSRWRKRLFLATSRITADAAEYFGLPRDRTVIMGARIEV